MADEVPPCEHDATGEERRFDLQKRAVPHQTTVCSMMMLLLADLAVRGKITTYALSPQTYT